MPGADLSGSEEGKAPSEMPALKPYWGKPVIRNFREDEGNNGIMRSRFSAMAPLDTIPAANHCFILSGKAFRRRSAQAPSQMLARKTSEHCRPSASWRRTPVMRSAARLKAVMRHW